MYIEYLSSEIFESVVAFSTDGIDAFRDEYLEGEDQISNYVTA